MAAAGAPADPGLVLEVRNIRTTLQGLETTVIDLVQHVQQLKTDMSDLHSRSDGGVHGESYASDSGPAVRAKTFEALAENGTPAR